MGVLTPGSVHAITLHQTLHPIKMNRNFVGGKVLRGGGGDFLAFGVGWGDLGWLIKPSIWVQLLSRDMVKPLVFFGLWQTHETNLGSLQTQELSLYFKTLQVLGDFFKSFLDQPILNHSFFSEIQNPTKKVTQAERKRRRRKNAINSRHLVLCSACKQLRPLTNK